MILIVLVLMVLLVACGPSDADCDMAWDQMDVDYGDEGTIVNMILNTNFAPDTVGHRLKECIESGWAGYR